MDEERPKLAIITKRAMDLVHRGIAVLSVSHFHLTLERIIHRISDYWDSVLTKKGKNQLTHLREVARLGHLENAAAAFTEIQRAYWKAVDDAHDLGYYNGQVGVGV